MNADYIKNVKSGLVDGKGIIKLDFIKNSKYPQMLANEMSKATPKLSSKQARSFYNVANKVYLDVIAGVITMEEVIVELTMMSSRVTDKLNKGHIPVEFKDFIEANVDVIHDVSTLKAFILHFEAICNNLKDNTNSGNSGRSGGPNQASKAGTYKPNNGNKNNNGGNRRW
jgi:hypothetical protein